jgi:hypothetical protein
MHSISIAKPDFRQRARVRHIVRYNGHSRRLLYAGLDVCNWPADVGREYRFTLTRPSDAGISEVKIKASGQTYAYAIEGPIFVRSNNLLDRTYNGGDYFLWVFRQRNQTLRNNPATQIRHGQRGLRRVNIQREYATLAVYIQESRPSATWKATHRTFHNPTFGKQFFDDERNRASLQSRNPCQVSSRDRLSGPDLIEDEIPVDLARYLI